MQNASTVRRVQSVGNLDSQIQQLVQVERMPCRVTVYGFAIHQLHGDKEFPVGLSDLVDGTDVRVVKGRSGARLLLESLQSLLVAGQLFGKELEGDAAAE